MYSFADSALSIFTCTSCWGKPSSSRSSDVQELAPLSPQPKRKPVKPPKPPKRNTHLYQEEGRKCLELGIQLLASQPNSSAAQDTLKKGATAFAMRGNDSQVAHCWVVMAQHHLAGKEALAAQKVLQGLSVDKMKPDVREKYSKVNREVLEALQKK